MSARPSRVATPSSPLVGKIKDKRRAWYPVGVLAAQSNRPVTEIVGWIESGELRGFHSSNGWLVHRDQLDTWRELCAKPREWAVYNRMNRVLDEYPDLRPLYDEMNQAALARTYDKERHDLAKAAWAAALNERGIRLEFGSSSVGFGDGYGTPDPLEPGFGRIDHNRYSSAAEMEADV